ncbi:MAG: hypothetical protein ACJ74U_10925 [Jatrophihabitantaceae bacterium]
MSRTFKDGPGNRPDRSGPGRGRGERRNISVRAVRREPPDLRKLSRALIQLAMDEAEAEAQQFATKPDEQADDEPSADQERHD